MRWWRNATGLLAIGLAGVAHAAAPPRVWHEASSPHFVVYSDDGVEQLRDFTTRLERFDKAMRVMRALDDRPPSPAQRVTVYVLRDTDAVERLMGTDGVAGVYMPRIAGPVAFVPRETHDRGKLALTPLAVLLHEYAHHFMFTEWGDRAFPAWFVEGFAEFNATAIFQPERLLIGAPPLYRAYGLIDDQAVPARLLLTGTPGSTRIEGAKVQTFYGRSWLLTHYLMLSDERRPLLKAYLTALNDGKNLKDAAALLGDLTKLDVALNRYSRKALPMLGLGIDKLPIGAVTVRALSPAETAIMPVRLRSQRGVTAKTAPAVATDARKVAAAWPNDPAVQVALAEAEYDGGQFEAADAAAARALLNDPTSRRAMIYRGLAQSGIAQRDHADAARWKAVRQWFVRANKLDPDDPWPLVAFYQAYRASGEAMSANAEVGLDYAYRLAPFDRDLAMTAAMVHIRHREWEKAAPPLRRIAYDPHGGGAATVATTLLAAVERHDVAVLDKAVAAMDAGKAPSIE